VTCTSLARDLDRLDIECNKQTAVSCDMTVRSQGLEVTSMDEEKLIVHLEV
jgi:hypothetical protein